MIVGFTGTRKGMNERQLDQLTLMLQALRTGDVGGGHGGAAYPPLGSNVFHFGGAHGADLAARKVAKPLGYDINWHPAPGVDLAKLVQLGYDDIDVLMAETWHEVFPPLVRNHHIVNAAEVLVAAPHVDAEELRSGTWATIRYARAKGIPVVMLSRGPQ
jgi:hypothetical protein